MVIQMNKMKQFLKLSLLGTVIYFAFANNSVAQVSKESLKNSTPEQRAKLFTDTMKTVLKLNTSQYSSVYKINLDIANKNAGILKSDAGKLSKFKKIKDNQDVRDKALQKVLSKDQFILYKQKETEIISNIKGSIGSTH